MVITIVKILMLVFVSAILMLQAAYSTVVEARAKRTILVYEIVVGVLIVSEKNFMLGVIEFIIFQVMTIFSLIATIYAYAGIEIINKSKSSNVESSEECTTLVSIPFRRGDVEVDKGTITRIQSLTLYVFFICTTMLVLVRPVLLFPFYGKNWSLFIVSLVITITNFQIAANEHSLRAIDSITQNSEFTLSYCIFLIFGAIVFFCVVQAITGIIYCEVDGEAIEKTSTMGEPRICSKILPINQQYNYEDKLPYSAKKLPADDNTYLIENHSEKEYFFYLSNSEFVDVWDKHNQKSVIIHLANDIEPYVTVTDKCYVNPKGETKVSEIIYEIYIQREQILTY